MRINEIIKTQHTSTPISQDDYNNILESSPNNAYYEGKLALSSSKGI